MKFLYSIFIYFIFLEATGSAAPCCARNSATPTLIVGDSLSQINVGYALGNVVAEVNDEGIPLFKPLDTSEVTSTYRIDGATLLSDRFQMGASFNLVSHGVSRPNIAESTTGLGDSRISAGYELVTNWNYNDWFPQTYVFSVFTLPTGKSVYEAENSTLSDITGNGFYSLGFGSLFIKQWSKWDLFFIGELHGSLPRTFHAHGQEVRVIPGFGGSFGLGAGYSPGDGTIRIGFRVQPRYDQGRAVPAYDQGIEPSPIVVCDTGFDFSYLITDKNSLLVSYTDQTLLGSPNNSNLSRVFSLNFQHRWER